MFATRKTVHCAICGNPTPWVGSQRCDRCYILERAVKSDPGLARKVLETVEANTELQPAKGPCAEDSRCGK